MKNKIFISLIFLCTILSANGQRHLKGIKGIDLLGGVSGKGALGEFGYIQYLNNRFYLKPSIRYENGKLNDSLKFSSYSFNMAANYTLFNPGESLFINAVGGASFFMNSLDKKSFESVQYIVNKQNTMTYGIFVGVETEIFLGDRVVWITNFRQNFNFKKDYGNFAWYACTGLRFNIY